MTPGISLPHWKWRIDAEEVTNGGKMIDATWRVLHLRGLGDGAQFPPEDEDIELSLGKRSASVIIKM